MGFGVCPPAGFGFRVYGFRCQVSGFGLAHRAPRVRPLDPPPPQQTSVPSRSPAAVRVGFRVYGKTLRVCSLDPSHKAARSLDSSSSRLLQRLRVHGFTGLTCNRVPCQRASTQIIDTLTYGVSEPASNRVPCQRAPTQRFRVYGITLRVCSLEPRSIFKSIDTDPALLADASKPSRRSGGPTPETMDPGPSQTPPTLQCPPA